MVHRRLFIQQRYFPKVYALFQHLVSIVHKKLFTSLNLVITLLILVTSPQLEPSIFCRFVSLLHASFPNIALNILSASIFVSLQTHLAQPTLQSRLQGSGILSARTQQDFNLPDPIYVRNKSLDEFQDHRPQRRYDCFTLHLTDHS